MSAPEPMAATIRRETELLIGRLVMQNTTLTAQVNALAEAHAALDKTLAGTTKDLADTKAALTAASADRNGHVPEEIAR